MNENEFTSGRPGEDGARPGQTIRFDEPSDNNSSIDMLMDVSLQLTVELGRTRMTVRQVLELAHGSVVELDRLAGEAVDIFINDHKLARGEVVVVDDKFGVRITEMIKPKIGDR
jgi:flagellar motor switch protein FliN/FliY